MFGRTVWFTAPCGGGLFKLSVLAAVIASKYESLVFDQPQSTTSTTER